MRISDTEVQKILARLGEATVTSSEVTEAHAEAVLDEVGVVESIDALGEAADRRADQPLVEALVKRVIEAPDRDEMVEELRARIEAGTYNPTGDDIADAMIRRSIADRIQ
jgi:negative regulator of flagellin synthesis FlgM